MVGAPTLMFPGFFISVCETTVFPSLLLPFHCAQEVGGEESLPPGGIEPSTADHVSWDLTLSQTSPGFYVSTVQVFRKLYWNRRNCLL